MSWRTDEASAALGDLLCWPHVSAVSCRLRVRLFRAMTLGVMLILFCFIVQKF